MAGDFAIPVVWPGQQIGIPYDLRKFGKSSISVVGHAGIVLVNGETGRTKYYEYGRYGGTDGTIQSISVPDVTIENGAITSDSISTLMSGFPKNRGGAIMGSVFSASDGGFEKGLEFVSDKNNGFHGNYEVLGHHCYTFTQEVSNAMGTSQDFFDTFFGLIPTQAMMQIQKLVGGFVYTVEKEELYDFDMYIEDPIKYCFAAGSVISMADGSRKPIERISIGDEVLGYDSNLQNGTGVLIPGRVTRTYATPDKLVIDFHGLKVTPGHVFLCGDGAHVGQHQMLMEILRADGTIVHADGTVLRAATNTPLGTREDAFVQVAYLTDANDALMQSGQMRAGTLILTKEGETKSVLQCMEEEGYRFDTESGLIAKDDEEPHPLYWFGEIPRPEDYVLKRSDLTDADLYAEPDYRPEVATSESRLGRGFTPAEGTLHATAAKRAGETVH